MKVIPVTSGTLLATISERWSDSLIDNFILETDTGIVHVMLGHTLYNFLLFTPQKLIATSLSKRQKLKVNNYLAGARTHENSQPQLYIKLYFGRLPHWLRHNYPIAARK